MFSMIFAAASIPVPSGPGDLVPAGEQGDSPAGGKSPLQLDGAADVAGVALAAGLLDIGPDRIEFTPQFLDVFSSEVGVQLDVGDGHSGLLDV